MFEFETRLISRTPQKDHAMLVRALTALLGLARGQTYIQSSSANVVDEAFLCDDLHRAHYGTSSHVEAISHPATLRGQRQDVYSKTVKSSCSPATQGSTITGRCRRFEGRVRSQSLELTRGEENHPCSSYSYRTNAASIMDNRERPVAL